jgi:hypothetical protein
MLGKKNMSCLSTGISRCFPAVEKNEVNPDVAVRTKISDQVRGSEHIGAQLPA